MRTIKFFNEKKKSDTSLFAIAFWLTNWLLYLTYSYAQLWQTQRQRMIHWHRNYKIYDHKDNIMTFLVKKKLLPILGDIRMIYHIRERVDSHAIRFCCRCFYFINNFFSLIYPVVVTLRLHYRWVWFQMCSQSTRCTGELRLSYRVYFFILFIFAVLLNEFMAF